MGTVHCSTVCIEKPPCLATAISGFEGWVESLDVRDACEQCGNVVGGRSLIFVRIFSWSFVHLTRRCVDCGWVRFEIDRYFPANWFLRCSIRCAFFSLGSFHRKDSWRQRRTEHARRRKNIANDAAFGRPVAALSLLPLGQFQKMFAQLPRKLLVPRLDDVRKCFLTSFGQEQAH